MSLSDLNSKEAVLRAIAEYDELGAKAFLERYRFGVSRRYLLAHQGSTYDSKAIAGVAYGYEFPESGPLRSDEFSGGLAGAATKLRSLGFHVTDETGERPDHSPDRPTMDTPDSARSLGRAMLIPARDQAPNVILLGCVKRKLTVPAAPVSRLPELIKTSRGRTRDQKVGLCHAG